MKFSLSGFFTFICLITILIQTTSASAQVQKPDMTYTVSMENPSSHFYHVRLTCRNNEKTALAFKMSAWTPGFYEIVDYAAAVSDFHSESPEGKQLSWKRSDSATWTVETPHAGAVIISYKVKAENPFIGNINLDENYGYIIPGALLLYLEEAIKKPVSLEIKPSSTWNQFVATGLDSISGRKNTFYAPNFDVLFDSPLLMGKLQTLPSFEVEGKQHQFIGYDLGKFNTGQVMRDLKKIVLSASGIIGDIPYSHYSFLAVGMKSHGFGGIEHLNSVSFLMYNGNPVSDSGMKSTFYSFLAHEYFHLYNVKRIRPVELGPFDYSRENYTDLLWISEGFTDYYEYLILRGAGLLSSGDVLRAYQQAIGNFENKPGHLVQSAYQASRGIWGIRGNPNARTPEELAKTVSIYDKGCAIGLMLDLKIRHETNNRYSLDNVMRALYKDYYQGKKRGFTDAEFWDKCERFAGVPLTELIEYASTTKAVNYPMYLAYAGLAIDTLLKPVPGGSMGAKVGYRDSIPIVREIEWQSPAMQAGLQQGDRILTLNGIKAGLGFENTLTNMKAGDQLNLGISRQNKLQQITLRLKTSYEKSFAMTPLTDQTALEKRIYTSWLREN